MAVIRNRIRIGSRLFDGVNAFLMIFICFVTLYPFWYVLVNSLNDASDAVRGGIYWWPRIFSLESYRMVFMENTLLRAFGVSALRVVVGTFFTVLFTSIVAYALSKKHLLFRNVYIALGTVTLFFGGGLIPYYLVIKSLGLLESFWVYIWPTIFSFYNLIIFQAFFKTLPGELEESAHLDGAGDLTIFFRIVVPLSLPVMATMALFAGVYHWNDFFYGVIFITSRTELLPIQTILYKTVAEAGSGQIVSTSGALAVVGNKRVTSLSVRLATMMVTTAPILCVYPFLQKYFIKGLLIGSVKG